MLRRGSSNIIVWIGVVAIVGLLWFFVARTRLHIVDPLAFIAWTAFAAAGLTALLWWEIAGSGNDTDDSNNEGQV